MQMSELTRRGKGREIPITRVDRQRTFGGIYSNRTPRASSVGLVL